MYLDSKTKKDLRQLIISQKDKKIDEDYINLFLEIINSNSIFPQKVIARNDKETAIFSTDYEELDIKYNLEGFKKRYAKSYEHHKKQGFDYDLEKFYEYWFPYALIHETSHIYQLLCANDSLSKHPEINQLYQKIYNSFKKFRNIDRLKYEFFHDKYSLERYANIIPGIFLADVFSDTELDHYSKLANINSLLSCGYSLKRGNIISPIERTFKYLRINDKIEASSLSFEERFIHGFKISDEDFYYIYEKVLADRHNVDYDKTIERLKTLIKKD